MLTLLTLQTFYIFNNSFIYFHLIHLKYNLYCKYNNLADNNYSASKQALNKSSRWADFIHCSVNAKTFKESENILYELETF